ncbi:g6712 [Coccomyxa elongata]
MPSPPPGLFQLPKLPVYWQQSQPEARRPAKANPSDILKPEALLGFNFHELPSFGQLPDSSAPWGFKLHSRPSKRQHPCRMGHSNAPDQARGMMPATRPQAAKAASSISSAPVLSQQSGESIGFPVDT